MPTISKSAIRREAKEQGFRSGFELKVAGRLDELKADYEYEPKSAVLEYTVNEKRKYLPDFVVGDIVIECKGRLTAADRKKLKLVKEQHPGLDIRLVFQYNNKLNPRSKTRYSDWAEKHGFPWALRVVPKEWFA